MRSSYLVLPPNSSRVTIAWNEIPTHGRRRLPEVVRNGKELFYRTQDNKIMVATYTASGDCFQAYKPRLWSSSQFTGLGFNFNFDPHLDGKRFAVLKALGVSEIQAVNKVSFILNFSDELRRKVPAQK
jgi:hypothetical protein